MRRAVLVLVAVPIALFRADRAAPQDLASFLRTATEAARSAVPLRADGELVVVSAGQTMRDAVVVLLRPPGDLYLELRQAGVKALLIAGGTKAYIVRKGDAAPGLFAPDAPLAESDFTREDLQPFNATRYLSPSIVDTSAGQLTVQLDPEPSQYSLVVITFDREKAVPVKTLYYRDTTSNLVKMRRDGDHVAVAGRWLPGVIIMEHFQLRTQSTLRLAWREEPALPAALFQPTALAQPSGLRWPDAP